MSKKQISFYGTRTHARPPAGMSQPPDHEDVYQRSLQSQAAVTIEEFTEIKIKIKIVWNEWYVFGLVLLTCWAVEDSLHYIARPMHIVSVLRKTRLDCVN